MERRALKSPQEMEFTAWGKRIAGRLWPGDAHHRTPAIAIHGWLDNAASFDFVAPLLECPVFAVDMAGNGRSEHRSAEGTYNIWQDVGDLIQVVRQLGWQKFTLIGHSRGAAVACLLAATFPEKVDKLIMLDGFMPEPLAEREAVRQLRQSVDDRVNAGRKSTRLYRSLDDAAAPRMRGRRGLSAQAALAIARRGVIEGPEGFRWSYDPRQRGASEFKLSEKHSDAFVEALRCKALLIVAGENATPLHRRWLGLTDRVALETVGAGHHLHMEKPGEVAAAINRFLKS